MCTLCCTHQQVVFWKLNLKIDYTPLHERIVLDYKNVGSQSIIKAIKMFNWEELFQNKNTHYQFKLFNVIILDIAHNYIPNKCITCNDKDPPWLNDQVKRLSNQENEIFKKYLKEGRPNSAYENLQTIAWDLTKVAQKMFAMNVLLISSVTLILYQNHTNKWSKPLSTIKKSSTYTPNTS